MRDRLDELLLARAVLLGQAEVVDELLGVTVSHEAGDCDEAAVLRRKLLARPDLPKQDVVREVHQRGGEIPEHPLGTRWLRAFCVDCHSTSPLHALMLSIWWAAIWSSVRSAPNWGTCHATFNARPSIEEKCNLRRRCRETCPLSGDKNRRPGTQGDRMFV